MQHPFQRCTAILLLAAAAVAAAAAAAPPHPDPHAPHPAHAHASSPQPSTPARSLHAPSRPLLPACEPLLSRLHGHALGPELQVMQQHTRTLTDLEALVSARSGAPPSDPKDQYAWNHTWATDLTLQQLQEALAAQNRVVHSMRPRVQALLEDSLKLLEAAGLPSSAEVLSSCALHQLQPRLFPGRPEVSFMLQYFKRPWIIKELVQAVQRCSALSKVPSELLVNVDNPSEHQAWAEQVTATRGFVVPVFSNNVHEARGYNRLASLARGRVVIVLQDDEVLDPDSPRSPDCAWLRNLLTLFDRFPLVGAVGLKSYIWAFGPNNTHEGVYFRDPATKLEAQFVLNADYAPLAMRKSAWQHIGGIDETMSEPGECGIFSDWELCTRMWMAGYQVMYMPPPPKHQDQGHDSGTHRPETGERCWGRQGRLSSGLYWMRYGQWDEPLLRGLAQRSKELNAAHLEVLERPAGHTADGSSRFGGACPFATGCSEFEGPTGAGTA